LPILEQLDSPRASRTFDVRDVHTCEVIELRSLQPAVKVNLGHDQAAEAPRFFPRGAPWASTPREFLSPRTRRSRSR